MNETFFQHTETAMLAVFILFALAVGITLGLWNNYEEYRLGTASKKKSITQLVVLSSLLLVTTAGLLWSMTELGVLRSQNIENIQQQQKLKGN